MLRWIMLIIALSQFVVFVIVIVIVTIIVIVATVLSFSDSCRRHRGLIQDPNR